MNQNVKLMNKILLTVATFGLLTLFTSAYYSAPADSRTGYSAPALYLDNADGVSPLRQHHGEKVLLTFWSSVDATSRLNNMHYDRLARQAGDRYTHIAINMDRSQGVFDAIVAVDNLNRTAQYNADATQRDQIVKAWRLEDGYHSFLIDGSGKIMAIDPDETLLASIK